MDDSVGDIEIRSNVRDGIAFEDGIVAILSGELAQHADHPVEDGLRHLILLFLKLLVELHEYVLQFRHALLPLGHATFEGFFRQDFGLFFDIVAGPFQFILSSIEFLLSSVEELFEGCLGAQAVFGFHDGALHVDDGDLHLCGGQGSCQQQDGESGEAEGEA